MKSQAHPDELQELAELGRKFRSQQRGRRPGALARHVRETVGRICPESFDALLTEFEYQALHNRTLGGGPILRVNREWETVLYLDDGIEREATFKRLRNIAQIRKSRFSVSRESPH